MEIRFYSGKFSLSYAAVTFHLDQGIISQCNKLNDTLKHELRDFCAAQN